MKRREFSKIIASLGSGIGLGGVPELACARQRNASDRPAIPWVKGAFRHVLQPTGNGESQTHAPPQQWYVNDHCFVVDVNQTIHWFGITNPRVNGNPYEPGSHRHVGHATAKHPFGPWQEHPHAFALPEGTRLGLGACFVISKGREYFMLVDARNNGPGLYVAKSDNLFDWKWIEPAQPLNIANGNGTRDPCVIRGENGRYLLYVAGSGQGQSVGCVFVAESNDLIDWKWLDPALVTDKTVGPGALESPFVYLVGDTYYLFINYSHRQYEETLVFASNDPCRFDWTSPLCTLFAHAAEVFDWGGKAYISHCGIEDRHWDEVPGRPWGLWLAELGWR